ncbi:MAG TPA: cyclic nucleotide-binding domain-containing protein [bacterium]|nr:cyclic nucleotide-binding domain-containing protein [bacterium]
MVFGRSSKVALLEAIPLFRDLSRKQLEQVARLADEIEVSAGRRLATAGERGHELFVIVDGRATVSAKRGRTVHLGRGDFFGEMSLLDGGPRSATVDADSNMRLLVVGQREFWQLLTAAPSLTVKIMIRLSSRVRDAEAAISA